LILKVKPHITGDNKILLDLELRKDSPNYDYVAITGSGEPAINTRNVKSKVLLGNGDTVVIGGIFEKEKHKSVSGVPGLSRIPLLGWLFRNSQINSSKQEMIVLITPVIVNAEGKPSVE
jgi:type IV pilus assembly protein PilQ